MISSELQYALGKANSENKNLNFELVAPYVHDWVFQKEYNKFIDIKIAYAELLRILSVTQPASLLQIIVDQQYVLELVMNEIRNTSSVIWVTASTLFIYIIDTLGSELWKFTAISAIEFLDMLEKLPDSQIPSFERGDSAKCKANVLILRMMLTTFTTIQSIPLRFISKLIQLSNICLAMTMNSSPEIKNELSLSYNRVFTFAVSSLTPLTNLTPSTASSSNIRQKCSQTLLTLQNMNIVPLLRSLVIINQSKALLGLPAVVKGVLHVGEIISSLTIDQPNEIQNHQFVLSFYNELTVLLKACSDSLRGKTSSISMSYCVSYLLAISMCTHPQARTSARSLLFSTINNAGTQREKLTISILNYHASLLKRFESAWRVLPRNVCPINDFTLILQSYTKEEKGQIFYMQAGITNALDDIYKDNLENRVVENNGSLTHKTVLPISSLHVNSASASNRRETTGIRQTTSSAVGKASSKRPQEVVLSYDSRTHKAPRLNGLEARDAFLYKVDTAVGGAGIGEGIDEEEAPPLPDSQDDRRELMFRAKTAPVPTSNWTIAALLKGSTGDKVETEGGDTTKVVPALPAPIPLASAYPSVPMQTPTDYDVPLESLHASVLAFSIPDIINQTDSSSGADSHLEPVPVRFRDEEQYIATYSPLLLEELKCSLRSEITSASNGSSNRGGKGGGRNNGLGGQSALTGTCEMAVSISEEYNLSEYMFASNTAVSGNLFSSFQKDDLVGIFESSANGTSSLMSRLCSLHCLGIVSSNLKKDPKDKFAAVLSLHALDGGLTIGSEYTCMVIMSLATFKREWVALHSSRSMTLMPLASYLFKAAPVISALNLNKFLTTLQQKVEILTNFGRDSRQNWQFDRMLDAISKDLYDLANFSVDGSVLKATGIAKYLSKLQKNVNLTRMQVDQCRRVIAAWKEQVSDDNNSSTLSNFKGGVLVHMSTHVPRPSFITAELWTAFEAEYNASQLCAIEYACRPLTPTQDTRISLVQGPPGTGKTKTIIGIIAGLLQTVIYSGHYHAQAAASSPRRRVLLCAASNAAVDELLTRLLSGVRDGTGNFKKFRLVRLGKTSEDSDPQLGAVTLDSQVEAIVCTDAQYEELENVNRAIEDVRTQLDKATSIISTAISSKGSSNSGQQQEQHLKYQLSTLRRKKGALEVALDKRRAEIGRDLLSRADIVVSTLSSSGQQQIVEHLASFCVTFESVIVDEAAQTTEPSVLIPLRYGCKQLILVGDPRQLPPTVLSDDASRAGLSMSLFERLEKAEHEVLMLTMQYRMHPEIRQFPSNYFYFNQLVDGSKVKSLPLFGAYTCLRPLAFMDLEHSSEDRKHTSHYNDVEAQYVIKLIAVLSEHVPQSDIAVITPYSAQVRHIKGLMNAATPPQRVEVNSIDGFQGREKSIIIFSCVRTSRNIGFLSDERRLNVALTRAKHSLILVGRCSALRGTDSAVWRDLISSCRQRNYVRSIDSLSPVSPRDLFQTTLSWNGRGSFL